jgi:transcriptional regulator with XRE-family HTH domain
MARKPGKPPSKQGLRLAQLRHTAGLTQHELAQLLDVPQSNIAFWERSEKPPRSDILPKMAKVLGVSVEDLLDIRRTPTIQRQSAPVGKVREVFERVARLPRRQQEKIVEFVSAFVNQYEEKRASK